MAKATTAAKPAGAAKPRTRKAAEKPAAAAVDQQEGGAKAPVSLSGDQAAAASETAAPPAPDAPATATPATPPDSVFRPVQPGGYFSPLSRFPEGWKPAPIAAQEPPASAEEAQTGPEEAAGEAPELSAWDMPNVAEFPAVLTLANNTPAILVIQALAVRAMPFETIQATCATAQQYERLRQHFTKRAVQGRWNSEKGLQVTYVEN